MYNIKLYLIIYIFLKNYDDVKISIHKELNKINT